MQNEAFIYDAVRTPRSRGRADGSLNDVKPVELAAGVILETLVLVAFGDDVVLAVTTSGSDRMTGGTAR